jgi:Family of unknown function (DUF6348)
MTHEMSPEPLTDERILQLVGEKLSEFVGPWQVEGPLLKGPGSLGVAVGPRHVGDFRHVDLDFQLNTALPIETSLLDCASGFAADPEQAIRQAIAIWADTTASVGIELAERQGRLAGHFGPGEAECFPGWHTIIGGITGWGLGGTARAKRQWLTETLPWVELAPVITTGLTRDYYNAVRIFIGQGDGFSSCEVVINGVPHQAATAALAAMGWPRTEQMSTAKVFLLLVQPTGATQNG